MTRGLLVIKLRMGTHLAGGSKMVRKCTCYRCPVGSAEMHVPQLYCPQCPFWGNARRRVRTGEKLPPGITGARFAEKLGWAARQFRREKGDRPGTLKAVLRRSLARQY